MKNKLIQKLQCIIKELHLVEYKDDLYSSYSVSSSKDMTEKQIIHLINRLEAQKRDSDNARRRFMSNCLSVITSDKWMGFPNTWTSINALIVTHSIGRGKLLYQMSNSELKECHKRLIMAHKNGLTYRKITENKSITEMVNVVMIHNNDNNIIN